MIWSGRNVVKVERRRRRNLRDNVRLKRKCERSYRGRSISRLRGRTEEHKEEEKVEEEEEEKEKKEEKEQVTQGHNIIADGWAGASNTHPHPKPHSIHKRTKKKNPKRSFF